MIDELCRDAECTRHSTFRQWHIARLIKKGQNKKGKNKKKWKNRKEVQNSMRRKKAPKKYITKRLISYVLLFWITSLL
jgi:hypothetical protein